MLNFKQYSAERIIQFIKEKKSIFWAHEREKRALLLFRETAKRVPAYKDFLKKHKIKPEKIKTFIDFQNIPAIDKNNYLRQYPLEKLCWDGTLKKPLVFTATSGSTGEPFYFPRSARLDWEYSVLAELFIQNNPLTQKGTAFIIICLGMGVWIGGLLSYRAFVMASERGECPISILTPGINKPEIFKALKKLSPNFNQTILVGYPPFLKDIIDEAHGEGIALKKLNLRLLSGAEAYTEKFRDYLAQNGFIKNLYLDTLNIYGSADIGTMAYETPVAILIRRSALKNKKLFSSIFSDIQKTPTLAQYNSLFITFESSGGEILLTGNNTIPLVRYSIGDHGGALSFNELVSKLNDVGIDLYKEASRVGIREHIYEQPFVYVYERSDLSTTLYGLQIYPEIIREAILNVQLAKFLTGKFTMLTKFDRNQNQYLEINLELMKNKKSNNVLKKQTLDKIFHALRSKSSEFRELSDYLQERAFPKLVFWPHEHKTYFKPGIKQKWSVNST